MLCFLQNVLMSSQVEEFRGYQGWEAEVKNQGKYGILIDTEGVPVIILRSHGPDNQTEVSSSPHLQIPTEVL